NPDELQQLSRRWASAPPSGLAEDAALGLAPAASAPAAAAPSAPPAAAAPSLPDAAARGPVDAGTVVGQVASLSDAARAHAGSLIEQLRAAVLPRARDVHSVVPLVLGLLLSDEPAVRAQQQADLVQHHGQALADATTREADALAGLHPLLRLPLAQL